MNWIQKNWFTKSISVLFFYATFWCVFYGSAFFLPVSFFDNLSTLGNLLFILYFFVILPGISFFIPKYFKKVFSAGSWVYFLHTVMIISSIVIFIYIGIFRAFSGSGFSF